MEDNKYNKKRQSQNVEKMKKRTTVLFIIGMIIITALTIWMYLKRHPWSRTSSTIHKYSSSGSNNNINININNNATTTIGFGMKILYCMTTLSEYDSGKRATTAGYDRLQETLIPVLQEGVESMLRHGYQVDVVLICGYQMTRYELVRQALPEQVGLQIWDSATPIGYKLEDKGQDANKTTLVTRGLARQHRFVIKDKLQYYDFFVNFEDDMLIQGTTVEQFLRVTNEIYRLRQTASEIPPQTTPYQSDIFYGPLIQRQLKRIIPGFIRVEVLLDEQNYGVQEKLDPVPITDRPQLDPSYCCHLQTAVRDTRPANPTSDKLFMWETNIKALGVRKFPLQSKFQWVLMQRGPRVYEPLSKISDYWSGQGPHNYFGKNERRPDPKSFAHVNNQGGWMATRRQIWEWHTEICPGGFLPPFDPGEYNLDGLDMRNVEYWSGGMSLVTREHACNLQRIIPLDEEQFAKSLLYHTANNKQRQLHGRRRMFVKINDLYGELNTVVKNAQAEMDRRIQAANDALNNNNNHENDNENNNENENDNNE